MKALGPAPLHFDMIRYNVLYWADCCGYMSQLMSVAFNACLDVRSLERADAW